MKTSSDKKTNGSLPRRDFLKAAGMVATSTAWGVPQFIPSKVLGGAVVGAPRDGGGANERLTLGVIGLGGRGSEHLQNLIVRRDRGELNLAAVCDVDEERLERAAAMAGPQVDAYRDYRALLLRKDIDAVILATPSHWHGVQFTQAAECGKHIYCETPACSTLAEGKAMMAAARKAKIAVQIGAQGRSSPEAYAMHRFLANGSLGKITRVDCWQAPSPVDEFPVPDSEPPAELDYDLWLGPLRWRPYNAHCSHENFRWMLESGGGQLGLKGSQIMSCVMHWLGADGTGPVTVEAKGTSPTKGYWDSAVEMKVTYTFKNPDWVLTWNQPGEPVAPEDRLPEESKITRSESGGVLRGERGEVHFWGGDDAVWVERKVREWKLPADAPEFIVYQSPGHYEDWFCGIRTGEKTLLNVKAAVGVANLCNLGNLSFLLDRKLHWDAEKGEILADSEAQRLMARPQRFPYCL